MIRPRILVAAAVLAAASAMVGPAPARAATTSQAQGHDYYLALGDSLAAGWQPNNTTGVGGIARTGYADDLEATLSR